MAARLPLCSSPMAAPFMGSRVGCLTTSKMVMMCSKNHTHTRSSTKNKVSKCVYTELALISSDVHLHLLLLKQIFEDRSAGIVCYRDENGEITCEGYDEGPRFHQSISRFNQDRRQVYQHYLLLRL